MVRSLSFYFVACVCLLGRATAVELVQDPHFQDGFALMDPTPGKKLVYGQLTGLASASQPAWNLAQWASKFPLQPADKKTLPDDSIQYADRGKTIIIGKPGTPEADLSLGVWGRAEYDRQRRKGENWVHLLVQQNVENSPSLGDLMQLPLHVEARLLSFRDYPDVVYDPHLHAAHIHVTLTIQNRNRQSPGFGQYYWFQIVLYDNRDRVPKAFAAKDSGKADATGKFIFAPSGDTFTKDSVHDGQWITIDKDLMPLVQQGLTMAWSRNFLPGSKTLADYRIGLIAVGWEVSGIYDVNFQIRNLSLQAVAPEKPQ